MADDINFDTLVKNTMPLPDGTVPDIKFMDELYGHLFALPYWYFVARGTIPDVRPYVATHPGVAEGRPMIRIFTDSDRLQRFVKENNLEDAEGSILAINIPTESIVPYLEGFGPHGVYGVWFNSDLASTGFFVPLGQLRIVQEHLKQINWQPS